MMRYLKSVAMLLAVTLMVGVFTALPVRAEGGNDNGSETTETQSQSAETVPGATGETPTDSDATEPKDAEPTPSETTIPLLTPLAPSDGSYVEMEANVDREVEMSLLQINNIQDLANAFGKENVIVDSNTDLHLNKDVVLPTSYIFIESGTYNIDFRGFHIINSFEVVYINGADVTFLDSSSSQNGGTQELDDEDLFTCWEVRAGSLTIQSGTYTGRDVLFSLYGGTLSIEGGRFTSTSTGIGWPLLDAGTLSATNPVTQLKISGGYFEMLGANAISLFNKVQATLSNVTVISDKVAVMYGGDPDGFLRISSGSYYGSLRGLEINRTDAAFLTGGTFSSDSKQQGIGVAYYSDGIGDSLDILCSLSDGYMFNLPMYSSVTFYDRDSVLTYTQPNVSVISTNSVEGFVDRLYTKTLERQPDLNGFQDWVSQLKDNKSTGSGVAFGFFFSSEFIRKNISDSDFVTLMYRAFFNREPDTVGKQNWLNALENGGTRKYVFAGFANSQEWKALCDQYQILPGTYASDEPRDQNIGVTAFVQRLYTLCLNRKPDAVGIDTWTAALNNKSKDGAHVAYGFFFSSEFTIQNLSNEDYVEVLYEVLLGRASDSDGKANWVKQLKSGKSRLEVFRGFAHSQEFDKICAQYGIVSGTV